MSSTNATSNLINSQSGNVFGFLTEINRFFEEWNCVAVATIG